MKHILNFNELHEDFSQYLEAEDLEITDDGINELLSDDTLSDELYDDEEYQIEESKKSGVTEALRKKAKASGIPMSILRKVFSKGMQAWNAGHRPGVAQHQWGMGRVNSFITGAGGARKADAKLWAQASKAKKRKK